MTTGTKCADKDQCQKILNAVNSNQPFIANGKFYTSLDDWLYGNHVKKRIYTIEEANKVAGDRNTVTIRYK